MTVRSKSAQGAAKVVELPSLRGSLSGQSVSRRSRGTVDLDLGRSSAELLSIRQHLNCKGSMSVNDLAFIEQAYSRQIADTLYDSVLQLLYIEFGHLRVHRYRGVFIISHHCMETLVAGLLRVQFHSRQIPLPATRDGQGLSDLCGVPVSWGVGQSLSEAQHARLAKIR